MNERLGPAEGVLRDLGIQKPQDIDLEAIAWTLGAAVNYRSLDKCEAMIVGGNRHAIITVNSNSIPTRQRFSIAHEIGHWQLHRGQILFCGARDIGDPANSIDSEKQADRFASDLILPSFLLTPRLSKIKSVSLNIIREIAEEFSASATATLVKLVELDQFPIIAVCHSKVGRRWFRRARMIPDWWFPRSELDSDSFAFDLLFSDVAEDTYPRKIDGDAWFDFRGADRFEICEQSFRLPHGEVLTMLALPDEAVT